eukprot:1821070-Prymnesium_polylepis.1
MCIRDRARRAWPEGPAKEGNSRHDAASPLRPSATHARALAEPAACSACRQIGLRTWLQRPRRGRSTTRREESAAASDRRRLAHSPAKRSRK